MEIFKDISSPLKYFANYFSYNSKMNVYNYVMCKKFEQNVYTYNYDMIQCEISFSLNKNVHCTYIAYKIRLLTKDIYIMFNPLSLFAVFCLS